MSETESGAAALATDLRDGLVIDLWPGTPPGSEGVEVTPTIVDRSTNLFSPDRALIGVDRPTLTVVRPDNPNGASVVAAPGGGYARIVMDKEGLDIARALLCPLGITVFLMTYRLPAEGHASGPDAPIADGRRAVRTVRANARAWGLDPTRIGFLGASAAGHIGATLAADPEREVHAPIDETDEVSARPDFALLLYPVVTMDPEFAHAGSRTNLIGASPSPEAEARRSPDRNVKPGGPEVFLVLADDDASVPSENSIRLYQALKRAGTPTEMHIYRDGGHGFAINHAPGLPVTGWPKLASDWLKRIGVA